MLVEAHHIVADPPGGPPAPYLGGVQILGRKAEGRQGAPVVAQVGLPGRPGDGQVKAAGLEDQLEPGLALDFRPRVIGGLRQRGVHT